MKEQRIRERASYEMFKKLLDFLNTNPSREEVLKAVYNLLDSRRLFGSERNAGTAYESLKQVLSDARQTDG